ncbi:hypothetical protein HK101_009572 [Irineochytrium annulatum]|nr:hypothetical protein HK101_009572 [Irineochytrium annulatum]
MDIAPPTYASPGFPAEADDLLEEYSALVLRIIELDGSEATAAAKKANMVAAVSALKACDGRVKKAEEHLANAQAEFNHGAVFTSAKEKLASALKAAQMHLEDVRSKRSICVKEEQASILEHSSAATLADELASTRARASCVVRMVFDTVFLPHNASLERELDFYIGKMCKYVSEIVNVHKASSALRDAGELLLAVGKEADFYYGKDADFYWHGIKEHSLDTATLPGLLTDTLPNDIAHNIHVPEGRRDLGATAFGYSHIKNFEFLPAAKTWLTERSQRLNTIANKIATKLVEVARALHDFRVGLIEDARPHAGPLGGMRRVSEAVFPAALADLKGLVYRTVKERLELRDAEVAKVLGLNRTFEDEEDFFFNM